MHANQVTNYKTTLAFIVVQQAFKRKERPVQHATLAVRSAMELYIQTALNASSACICSQMDNVCRTVTTLHKLINDIALIPVQTPLGSTAVTARTVIRLALHASLVNLHTTVPLVT